jgi:hypothetical protein
MYLEKLGLLPIGSTNKSSRPEACGVEAPYIGAGDDTGVGVP